MTVLRPMLGLFGLTLFVYAVIVILQDGFGFFPIFFNELFALTWQGHFNLDFASYLVLSALWVAWRSGFTPVGIATAAAASVLGMMFFGPLVLVYAARAEGDLRKLLLGVHYS